MKSVLVIHGPNLNLLGAREPDIYGAVSLDQINGQLRVKAQALGLSVEIFQSNHEGDIVDTIGKAAGTFDALIINPAAYTHTSVAIRDAISACGIPTYEVHLSNIYSREDFRHHSMVAPVAVGQISGFGVHSYLLALEAVHASAETKG
jgi:3-dehydroquinate dehydratase II